jgi:hypothetical protein
MAGAISRSERKNVVVIVLWCLAVGLIVCWVSLTLRQGTRQDVLYNLTAILERTPIKSGEAFRSDLPFYNRLLFPLIHHAFSRMFPALSADQWYVFLRICCYQAGFLAFALVCRFCLQAPRSAIGLATAILALATIAGFNHPWEEPSDALDLMAIALGVGAILRQRFILCLVLSVVFAANRDSVAFLGVAWFILLATRQNAMRRAVEGFVICATSYGTAFGIRLLLSPQAASNFNTQSVNVRSLVEAFVSFNPLSWLPVLCASFVLFLPFLDLARPRVQRFAVLGMVLVLPTISFGLVNEIRIFLPTFIMLAFAVAGSGEERASP